MLYLDTNLVIAYIFAPIIAVWIFCIIKLFSHFK